VAIQFNEAIYVAIIGLTVNAISAIWLHKGLPSGHHDHSHRHHEYHDHNLRAAYLHVIADALTSVLAIVALIAGKYFGWIWLDATVGIVGALVILKWAWGLLKTTGAELVDFSDNPEIKKEIVSIVEVSGCCQTQTVRVISYSGGNSVVVLGVVCHQDCTVASVRQRLTDELPDLRPVIELTNCHCRSSVAG
jgi:cation diffusion facilitator family transporter